MSWVPRYLSINRLTVQNIYIFTSALFHCLSMQRKISAVSMCLLAFSRTEQTEVWYPILNVLLVCFLFSLPYIIINLNNMSSALFLRFFFHSAVLLWFFFCICLETLMRTFMFLGFETVRPNHKMCPDNSGYIFMAYTVEQQLCV